MKLIKTVSIPHANKFIECPLNIELVNDSLVFFINEKSGDVHLYNIDLKFIAAFSVNSHYLHDLVVVDATNKWLIIGNETKDKEYFLSCFFNK